MSVGSVAVLAGGRSSEHEISLASAACVCDGLRAAGYAVTLIEVGRDGVWRCDGEEVPLVPGRGLPGQDAVFPVLHGPFGEDGTVQGLLECLDVPYVGAGVLASSTCMHKVVFKDLMGRFGIPQVGYRGVGEAEYRCDPDAVVAALSPLGLPVFVKPAQLGSSVGISRVDRVEDLGAALEHAFVHDREVIVEAAAVGREVECAVIGNDDPIASEPGEILLSARWYDYEAKYSPGGMRLVAPAPLPAAVRDRVRSLAVEAFVRSRCTGLARVDFFIVGDTPEGVLLNELNTIPGFTATSVFGSLFEASGIPYNELLHRLVQLALERHAASRAHRF